MARIIPFTRADCVFTAPRASVDCAGNTIPYLESQNKVPCDSRAEDFAYLEEALAERKAARDYIFEQTYAPSQAAGTAWVDLDRYPLQMIQGISGFGGLSRPDEPAFSAGGTFLHGMPPGNGFTVNEDEDAEAKWRGFFPFSYKSPDWDTFQRGFPSADPDLADIAALYSRLGTLKHLMRNVPRENRWRPLFFTFYDAVNPVDDFSVTVSVPVSPFFLQHAGQTTGGGLSALFVGRFTVDGYDFNDDWIQEKDYVFFETPVLSGGAFTLSIPSAANFVKQVCGRFGETLAGYKSADVMGDLPLAMIFSDFFHTGL